MRRAMQHVLVAHSIRANSTSAGILLWLVPMAAAAAVGLIVHMAGLSGAG